MPTPSTRTPVRIARGSYSNLNGSVSDLQDGEISYAEDQNKLYIKEGASLVALTIPAANPVFTGNATFDTNTLYVDGTNNRVGIQTATPRAILDLGTNADAATISNTPSDYQLGLNAAQSTTGDIGRNIGFIAAGAQKVTAAINSIDGGTNDTTSLAFWTGNGTAISEAMRIDNSGRLLLGTTTEGEATADNLTIADSGTCGITIRSGTSNNGQIFFSDGTSGDDEYRGMISYQHSSNQFLFKTNTALALTLDSSQNATFAGTVSDSKGNLRDIPKNSQANAYTLVAADAGKFIEAQNGVTIPSSVFSAGQAITILNQTGSDITLTSGSGVTLYNAADASTGNRTLASRGLATVLFASGSTAHISGAGLS